MLAESIPENKKFLIERELRFVRSGDKDEEDSAYFIDFHFGASKNWTVIHDLRLECGGRVAQIDHLLINRLLDVYILESKNYSFTLKINDAGEFLFFPSGPDKSLCKAALLILLTRSTRTGVISSRFAHPGKL